MEIDPALMAALVPGATLRVDYGPGKPANELRHVLAIVDDDHVVYKVWWPQHQRWEYKVEWVGTFDMEWKGGYVTLA